LELQYLNVKNPEWEGNIKAWAECSALYYGGDSFNALIETFLPKNPSEPSDIYDQRKSESSYSSYLGPIVDYFVSWLFSGSFTVSPKEAKDGTKIEMNPYYSGFQEDIGGDVDMCDFMRERMTSALVKGCAHWLVVMPGVDRKAFNKAEWEEKGHGNGRLQAVEREAIYDWEVDDVGKLEWCVIHSTENVRKGLGSKRTTIRETWDYYDRENVTTYSIEYEKKKPPGPKMDIPITIARRPHGCAEVPLVSLAIKDGMWIGNRVRSPQIEHFRLTCANAWLIRRTCYAMPILNLEDTSSVPVMGAGYYVAIGKDEKFGWSSPDSTAFDAISKETAAKRDEIFRIVHQMAQGMDNNAETVGRSADSKGMDVAATRIMLNAYGSMVRKAIEETYEILSDARGDEDVFWAVEGFNGFDTTSADSLIATAANAQLMGIPSKTFHRELKTKVALALMPELDQHEKENIREEISEYCDEHSDVDEMLPAEMKMKLELQAMKDKTALKLQDKKSDTTLTIQESKNANVRMELDMADGNEPGSTGKKKPDGGSNSQGAQSGGSLPAAAENLIKANMG
jgi:hypothetical protein